MGRALAASALALAVAILFWVGNGRLSRKPSPRAESATPAATSESSPPPPSEAVAASTGARPVPPDAPVVLVRPDLASIPLASGAMPVEMQIEAIASRSDIPDRLKARALIQMLPGLPEDVLAKAADEAASRLPDSDYAAVLLPVVLDPGTHGAAMSVFFADLMERPDALTLPALLAIARQPAHPFAPAARENLDLLLGANYAEDWPRWEAAIRKRLSPPP